MPTKKLLAGLDGASLSGEKWSGPIGSQLADVESLPIDYDFPVIDAFLVPAISDEALSKMNSDQKVFMQLVIIVTTGHVPKNFDKYKIGKEGLNMD